MASDERIPLYIVVDGDYNPLYIRLTKDPRKCTEFAYPVSRTMNLTLKNQTFTVQIRDHVSAKNYSSETEYYKEVEGVAVVYTVLDRDSFLRVPTLLNYISRKASQAAVVLVGISTDLAGGREVTYCEGVQLAEGLGVPFLETAAKAAVNADPAFVLLTTLVGLKQEVWTK